MPSKNLLQRSLDAVWHPCTQMKQHERFPLVPLARGEGLWLYDTNGRRYFDAVSSWWVNLFGHCNPRINAAIAKQLGTLEHAMLAGFTHAPVVELSERLSALTGGALGHAFFASDGASATEIALKMSAHFWRNSGKPAKNRFVCLAGSYHGETAGALSVTDIALFRDAYAPLVRQSETVPSPAAADPLAMAQAAATAADALDAWLATHADTTAALIIEPLVQCATGMAMYDAVYLQRARAACDRHQVHLIADEIAVGCGRTGSFFACEQAGIQPDFLCLSKGISGGYLPLSIVLSTDSIYRAFYDDSTIRGFLHSHSYTGNPLACTAALATLDIFETDQVLAANRQRAAALTTAAQTLAQDSRVSNFRRTGMIWAFDVRSDDPSFGRKAFAAGLDCEILLRPIGSTVYWMPPYLFDDADAAFLVQRTGDAIDAALAA
ncbi:adenosylmethionine--8-amino-7-oxononanoate transaminase [Niveibacterium sp. 24ML]|uniref:adenosylmethionine--8-amino-7-oxononanoate transaminase n=1 Tax=Niveibacterium sp. 24ML TaxID=2985512 RepID=UPI002271ED86|nr:adenosylmethionine--8-amino-7-oxononanoate transaminase [Niveibacterium sp. 24ML]MCX9155115.1 adenosylmethionine--8-amino-7-oxononanoate transaminase [Niveibacterium sp. 24ML]